MDLEFAAECVLQYVFMFCVSLNTVEADTCPEQYNSNPTRLKPKHKRTLFSALTEQMASVLCEGDVCVCLWKGWVEVVEFVDVYQLDKEI